MKVRNWWPYGTSLAFIACGLCLTQPLVAQESTMVLELSNYSSAYVSGEQIWFLLEIQNTSTDTLELQNPAFTAEIHIAAANEPELRGMRTTAIRPSPPVALVANQKRSFYLSNTDLGNSGKGLDHSPILMPGTYRAWATIKSQRSNVIEFVVYAPSPEDALLQGHISQIGEKIGRVPPGELVDECKRLIASHPQSKYAPNLYILCLRLAFYAQSPGELITTAREYIDRYPDHPAINQAVNNFCNGQRLSLGIARGQLSTDQAASIRGRMRDLAAEHPDSKVLEYFVGYYTSLLDTIPDPSIPGRPVEEHR
jgi:hypothetical protein